MTKPAPEQLQALMRDAGHVFNPDILKATFDIFTPMHDAARMDGITVHKDLAYGADDRHRLDVFAPAEKPDTPVPVVIYFHGGGFVAGARSPVPGVIYDNVPKFFARNGMIGVNATYRLAPDHTWPAGAQDVGAAIAWLKENIADYGGDPERIFVIGQSAGAAHVSTHIFMENIHGLAGPGVAGAILLSGLYAPLDPDYVDENPPENVYAYLGEDSADWEVKSPLYHIKPGHPPVFVVVSEYDPYWLAWPSTALVASLTKCDRHVPRFKFLAGHNHVSPPMMIDTDYDSLGPDILNFIADNS